MACQASADPGPVRNDLAAKTERIGLAGGLLRRGSLSGEGEGERLAQMQ